LLNRPSTCGKQVEKMVRAEKRLYLNKGKRALTIFACAQIAYQFEECAECGPRFMTSYSYHDYPSPNPPPSPPQLPDQLPPGSDADPSPSPSPDASPSPDPDPLQRERRSLEQSSDTSSDGEDLIA
jgi:hypothetical protein